MFVLFFIHVIRIKLRTSLNLIRFSSQSTEDIEDIFSVRSIFISPTIDLTLKKSNFLFLLCFKIAKIMFIPMRQQSRQRNSFFSSRFTSNLKLPACLLGMILVATEN